MNFQFSQALGPVKLALLDTAAKSEKNRWTSSAGRSHARKLLPLAKNAEPVSWFLMNLPCPVLDPGDNTCLAYRVRPAACSTHFVRSNPGLCSPHAVKSGPYVPADFDDLLGEFLDRLASNVAGFGILQLQLPLPSGILLAEAINLQTGLSLDKAVSMFLNEL